MKLVHQTADDIVILSVSGKIDTNTSSEFETEIQSVIDGGGKKILIDCTQLDHISSAGLRVILLAAKKLKRSDGKIVLSSLKEHVKAIFEIAGFSDMLPIAATIDEGINNF
ncbi:MAG: STAS domain-containing protein [Mangrovibacterium sp.]|nr:STAS domain-containing protein [Mangrovibacterium sp.]